MLTARTPAAPERVDRCPPRARCARVLDHFGSWNAGLRAAGLEVTHEPGKWTPDGGDRRPAGRRPRARSRGSAGTSGVSRLRTGRRSGSSSSGSDHGTPAYEPHSSSSAMTRAGGHAETMLTALRLREQELGRAPTPSELAHQRRAGLPDNRDRAAQARELERGLSGARLGHAGATTSGRRGVLAALRAASWSSVTRSLRRSSPNSRASVAGRARGQ